MSSSFSSAIVVEALGIIIYFIERRKKNKESLKLKKIKLTEQKLLEEQSRNRSHCER